MGASYSGLCEEGEVEHINIPPLPTLIVNKTETSFIFRETDPKYYVLYKHAHLVKEVMALIANSNSFLAVKCIFPLMSLSLPCNIKVSSTLSS